MQYPQVIHFSGQTIEDVKPLCISIDQFLQGAVDGKLYMVQYNDPASVLPATETLEKAKNVLSGATTLPNYNVINYNCESFATWPKTGTAHSAQGTNAMNRAANIAGASFALAGGAVAEPIGAVIGGSIASIAPPVVAELVGGGSSGDSGSSRSQNNVTEK